MDKKATLEVLHYPRLDTVMMVEDTIRKAKDYPSLRQLWLSLPKQTMYQTFKLIIKYLIRSNKILISKDGRIIWIFADTEKKRAMMHGRRRF